MRALRKTVVLGVAFLAGWCAAALVMEDKTIWDGVLTDRKSGLDG